MGLLDDILDWLTGGYQKLDRMGGGKGIYNLFEYDLSKARDKKEIIFYGDQLIITKCEDSAYIRLNDETNDPIDLTAVKEINSPFRKFYLSNDAGAGDLNILAGAEGIFKTTSNKQILMGKDGTNYRVIGVDKNGYIVSKIYGDNGGNAQEIFVSTDGYLTAYMRGWSGGSYPIIRTDTAGYMLAKMTGDDSGILRTVAVDSNGIMKANLTTQDISRIIIRNQNGCIESSNDASRVIAGNTTYDFVDISGEGAIKWFYLWVSAGSGSSNIKMKITIDNVFHVIKEAKDKLKETSIY